MFKEVVEVKPPRIYRHGIRRSYTLGCRCEDCKLAESLYMKAYRKRGTEDKHLTHGTKSSYVAGCRCDLCKQASHKCYEMYRERGDVKNAQKTAGQMQERPQDERP